ncbi:MAG: tetratricopeptide repeat protein, partial [Thermodesulfobacteriota bacterium]
LLSISFYEDAENKLEEFLLKWPDSHDLKVIHGRILFKNGNYLEALGILKEVAQAREDWAEPHIWMAMAYQRLGDSMSALAEGQLATRLAPKSHTAHRVLGDILREQKKFSMAENAYEMAENLRTKK